MDPSFRKNFVVCLFCSPVYFYPHWLWSSVFEIFLLQVRFLTKIYHPNIDKVKKENYPSFLGSSCFILLIGFLCQLKSLGGFASTFWKTNGALHFKLGRCFWGNCHFHVNYGWKMSVDCSERSEVLLQRSFLDSVVEVQLAFNIFFLMDGALFGYYSVWIDCLVSQHSCLLV